MWLLVEKLCVFISDGQWLTYMHFRIKENDLFWISFAGWLGALRVEQTVRKLSGWGKACEVSMENGYALLNERIRNLQNAFDV